MTKTVRVPFNLDAGRVRVYSVAKKQYVWVAPIDAREGIHFGNYTPYAPGDKPIQFAANDKECAPMAPADHLPPLRDPDADPGDEADEEEE